VGVAGLIGGVCCEIGALVRPGVALMERFAISSPIQFVIFACSIMLLLDVGDNVS
jgi:hypothetical protein